MNSVNDSALNNPVISFGLGLMIGSLVGTTGIVIFGLCGIAYYNKDYIANCLPKPEVTWTQYLKGKLGY